MLWQPIHTCPQRSGLVAVLDEQVLDLWGQSLAHFESLVGGLLEVAVVAHTDVLGRNKLQHLYKPNTSI